MEKRRVNWKILGLFMIVLLLAGCASMQATAVEAQAAVKNGWKEKIQEERA